MAYSRITTNGDGKVTTFALPFPYLEQSHVRVSVPEGFPPKLTWLTASTVRLSPAPLGEFTIYRDTPKDVPLTDFTNDSVLNEEVLDLMALQMFYIAQEVYDSMQDTGEVSQESRQLAEEALVLAGNALDLSTQAESRAQAAEVLAANAVRIAERATEGAQTAAQSAATATGVALEAKSSADVAVTTANNAALKVAQADEKAAQAAKTSAASNAVAEEAKAIATVASATANAARSVASSASTASNTAINTADTALRTADGADKKARDAVITATNASSVATTAAGRVDGAVSVADSAAKVANEANITARATTEVSTKAQATAEQALENSAAAQVSVASVVAVADEAGQDAASARAAAEAALARITSATKGSVSVFNGRDGIVEPQAGDYTPEMVGLGNVDNVADLDKPISTAVQSALDGKASKEELQTVERAVAPQLEALGLSKADKAHTHPITGVVGLQDALGTLSTDVRGLQASVNTLDSTAGSLRSDVDKKSAQGHSHTVADVAGLGTTLDTHRRDIDTAVNGLAGKAAAAHKHSIQDISELQTSLNNLQGGINARLGAAGGTVAYVAARRDTGVFTAGQGWMEGKFQLSAVNPTGGTTVISFLREGRSNASFYHKDGGWIDTDVGLRVSGDVWASGNVTAYSDIRLKTDLTSIRDALAKVQQLTGYTYTRRDTGERHTGLVAQDVQRVLPEAVKQDAEGYLSVAYGNLIGLLVEAVKDLAVKLAKLENT